MHKNTPFKTHMPPSSLTLLPTQDAPNLLEINQALLDNRLLRRMLRRGGEGLLAVRIASIRRARRSLPDGRELCLLGGRVLPIRLLLLWLRRRLVLLLWLGWLGRDRRWRLGQGGLV